MHIFLSLKIRLPSVTDTCLTAALLPGVLYGRCYKKREEEKKIRKEKKRGRKESEKKRKERKKEREKGRFDMSGSFDNKVTGRPRNNMPSVESIVSLSSVLSQGTRFRNLRQISILCCRHPSKMWDVLVRLERTKTSSQCVRQWKQCLKDGGGGEEE